MRVLVIGGGIAGASVAYFLTRAGATVTLIDAGQHAASSVPSALLNPVRGQSGKVEGRALEGLALTGRLIEALSAQGHPVAHARSGLLRPVPDDAARARFERHLPPELAHAWRTPEQAGAVLAPGWAHALWLPQGGWVDGPGLCVALRQASGAEVVRGQARRWGADWAEVQTDTDLHTLRAEAVVFCGGSVGTSWASPWTGETSTHRMGTLLHLDRAPSAVPLSYGAYLAPHGGSDGLVGGVLGGTFETPAPQWQPPHLPLGSLGWLLGKGQALADLRGVRVTGRWTGSRLSGLRSGQGPEGWWRLTGLGSKGFLLGPLLASDLAAQVTGHGGRRASRGG